MGLSWASAASALPRARITTTAISACVSCFNGAKVPSTYSVTSPSWAARTRGVPVVDFPHSPVANTVGYNDLPVGYAGLRGQREVDYYTELGVTPGRISIVGNPMIPETTPPTLNPDAPPVLALSAPWSISMTTETLKLVRDGVEGPVVLAPHQFSSISTLERLLDPDWTMSRKGHTFDALLAGPLVSFNDHRASPGKHFILESRPYRSRFRTARTA